MNFDKGDITTIIWDWNGTLFNDVDLCIASINNLLIDRRLPELDKARYQANFDFPVQDYYRKIGFDFNKEPFEIPAQQFIDNYFNNIHQAVLNAHAEEILLMFKKGKKRQLILSAAEQEKLKDLLNQFAIIDFFEAVSGLSHDYATSKIEQGREMLRALNIKPENAVLIGDTLHDYEVARAMQCNCILFDQGHHSREKLEKCGVKVVSDLSALKNLLL